MNKSIKNALVLGAIALACSSFIYGTATGTNTNSVDVANHVYLPNTINFAGEKAPLNIVDVKERLDREMIVNINLHSSTTLAIKRAKRYFPIIEPILKKNGIPEDFKYLAVIESGLANVVSSAGARGFWQFMPATAKEFNMEVTDYVDERYDVAKATEAACEYFKRAKNRFGTWTLAAASYNRGMAGVSNQLTAQQVSDYYDLLLTEETSRYVFRILALKEIMQNAEKYGYALPESTLYQPIKTRNITVNTDILDLAAFAKEQGINYKILKLHNPWMRDTKLIVTPQKDYIVAIPTEGYN
ncbi:lytic transglycosylase domain-containing protein [Flavobacterium sp. NKUCC04_CG]|uniref:lytic transglycosylase domain-containing protein n=1 Tax=Flavobacterium sp. NKUCC04_CG TaxID=2842121 RepID=UPI001C5B2C80|nr:lytic transglycosylase domain-containing protein [Flavobacterium sp. NKUCC04_CG]MBW3519439.1 lytic transglycosylase domain-containing protein [Flavobacterium sp. NKUCC04_CG]